MENGHDGMFVAQCSDSAQVHNLTHHMGSCKVIPLCMPEAVQVEHHLRQQPVVRQVLRCVDEVGAFYIRFYGERQEVMRDWVDVEVGLTSSAMFAGSLTQICLVEEVGQEQTTSLLERGQCLTSDRFRVGDSEGKSCVFGNARDSVWILGQLGHGEE